MSVVLPRLSHNIALATAWKQAHKMPPEIDAVCRQLPSIELNRHALQPGGFNGSIVRFGGRLLLAYRHPQATGLLTSLAMAELDDKFNVTVSKPIALPGPANDDPRLFEHNGSLYIVYVHVLAANRTTVRYGKLIEGKAWTVEGQTLVAYGKNDGTAFEKNWVPFSYQKKIHFIYQMAPEQVVIQVEDREMVAEWKSQGPWWKWGALRGGTTPLAYQGKLLRIFHSRLNNEGAPHHHRYYVGALLQDTEPPFAITAVSKRPILRGSEIDTLSETERTSSRLFKANVVFPLGMIEVDGGWLLSVGINDSHCALVKLTEGDLGL